MRIIVAGGRPGEVKLVHNSLSVLHARRPAAEAWARARDVLVVRYPANWRLHGTGATLTAFSAMLCDSRADAILVMPGGKHVATMIELADAAGIKVVRPAEGLLWDVDLVDEFRGLPHRLAGAGAAMLASASR